MIYELVPTELHDELKAFCHDLENTTLQHIEACPFCGKDSFYLIRSKPINTYRCKACYKYFTVATNTPFNRLTPFNWLELIFTNRIKNKSYLFIAEEILESSPEKVMRRDHAIIDYLQTHYPLLHKWYINHKQATLTPTLAEQHQTINAKITALLNQQTPICSYCASTDTTKVGSRTCYRCKRCRRSFNLLSDTPLNRLPRPDLWIEFINLLVAKKNNQQIEKKLHLNCNTVSRWRAIWCDMMKKWNCEALAIWCSRH
jgi:Transposase and inactivated derivatives